jgi:hypothetical protein
MSYKESTMELKGLHLLLSYQCTFECDHCFVWGSPFQSGVMTLENIRHILNQANDLGSVEWIYFEGGEPTLFYPILLRGIRLAKEMGFRIGVVSNAYWATSLEDALEWLSPFAGLVEDLSVSSDLFHYSELLSFQARNAEQAAVRLGIPIGYLSIAQPGNAEVEVSVGQIPLGQSGVMYRGRAAKKLAAQAPQQPWSEFDECPYEDLRDPGRLHLDPLGYLHVCQGISIGNIFNEPLRQIWARYDPDEHPVTGPLLSGGPLELVKRYHLPHHETYADACHLCDEARRSLRERFPEILAPDQMYGVYG